MKTAKSPVKTTLALAAGRGACSLILSRTGRVIRRPYLHGGFRRWWFPTLFLKTKRPLREYETHVKAHQASIATPEPMGWSEARAMPGIYRYAYFSRWIDDAEPLPRVLVDRRFRPQWVHQIVAILIGLHRIGIRHNDLNLNNWILDRHTVMIIDFDKASRDTADLGTALCTAIRRMVRSARKLDLVNATTTRLFFRLCIAASAHTAMTPHQFLTRLALDDARPGLWTRLGWLIGGGHRQVPTDNATDGRHE